MYSVDAEDAQLLLGYTDVFSDEMPNLQEEINNMNMHKAISIICELIRVRDAMLDPVRIFWGEFRIPFETVLKKEDRKSTRLNSSHREKSRMPSSA